MEISSILYATDGSVPAQKALDWVVDVAQRRQAKVIVVTAYEPISRDLGTPYLEELMAARTSEGEALVRKVAAVLDREGVPHDDEVLQGPAAAAVLEVARVRNVDLIVMGSRGLGRLEAALLGSVCQRVVQEAPCPVLIVR